MKKIDLEYTELFAGAIFVDDTDKIQIQSAAGDYIYTLPRGRGVVTTEQSDNLSLAFMCNDYYFVIYGFPDVTTRDTQLANLLTWSNGSTGGGGGGGTPLTYTTSTVTATTTPQTLLAANPDRKYYSVQAMSGGVVHIGEGTTPTATIANKKLLANGFYETANVVPTNQIEVRTVTGTNILTITEAQ